MPIKVPRSSAPRLAAEGPSDTDLMMALATMDKLGRLPSGLMDPTPFDLRFRGMEPDFLRRLDPSKQGQVEDRTQNEEAEQAQIQAARKVRNAQLRPGDQVMKALEAVKAKRRPVEEDGQ